MADGDRRESLTLNISAIKLTDDEPDQLDGDTDGGCMSVKVKDAPVPEITISSEQGDQAGPPIVEQRPSGEHIETVQYNIPKMVKPANELRDGDDVYRMQDNPRGFCVIVNIEKFEPHVFEWTNRAGTEEEGRQWANTFRQLGFTVVMHKDLSADKIIALFQEYSVKAERTHNAFVGVLLSHGKPHHFVGADGRDVKLEEIFSLFNNQNCVNLQHKPKLFFIQACRGEKWDMGVTTPGHATDAGGHNIAEPVSFGNVIPSWSDMVICYSTIHGYVANRNEVTGSWFGDALLKVFNEHAHECELNNLFMKVNQLLQSRVSPSARKQSIEVVYRGWTRSLYFNPGIYEV